MNQETSTPATATSASLSSVQRRRKRKSQTVSDDSAEYLTKMSVRGLDLDRYSSVINGVIRCAECEKRSIFKTFKNKYSFQRHAYLFHEGAIRKVFPCPVCGKEFSRPDKMKIHRKEKHGIVTDDVTDSTEPKIVVPAEKKKRERKTPTTTRKMRNVIKSEDTINTINNNSQQQHQQLHQQQPQTQVIMVQQMPDSNQIEIINGAILQQQDGQSTIDLNNSILQGHHQMQVLQLPNNIDLNRFNLQQPISVQNAIFHTQGNTGNILTDASTSFTKLENVNYIPNENHHVMGTIQSYQILSTDGGMQTIAPKIDTTELGLCPFTTYNFPMDHQQQTHFTDIKNEMMIKSEPYIDNSVYFPFSPASVTAVNDVNAGNSLLETKEISYDISEAVLLAL